MAPKRPRMITRFRCVHCGKLTAGRLPRAFVTSPTGRVTYSRHDVGDGSERYPRWHKLDGKPCPGNRELAEWVDVPAPKQRPKKRKRRP